MRLPEGVIVDLDDTLFREHDYVLSGYAAVIDALPLGVSLDDGLARLQTIFAGPERSRAFNAFLEPLGKEELVPQAIDIYRNHLPRVTLLPEAQAFLQAARDAHRLAIVTDGPLRMQRNKVEALGVARLVDAVICSDAIDGRNSWKPSPVPYEAAAAELGVNPEQCIYVGDNPHKDFLGARRAGMASVRVRAPWQLHATCEAADAAGEPDVEVDSLTALVPLVRAS